MVVVVVVVVVIGVVVVESCSAKVYQPDGNAG